MASRSASSTGLDLHIKKLHRSQKLSEGMLEFLSREEMVQVTALHQRQDKEKGARAQKIRLRAAFIVCFI